MLYHSTRSKENTVDSAQAVLNGLAPDGGLYVPEALPQVDAASVLQMDTYGMANAIIGAMLPDIPNMETLVHKAYSGKFTAPDLTPTVQAGEFSVLELFHGPTSAFKDVALCMLPQLLTAAKTHKGMDEDILILTATSGDTGKAALEGFKDVPGIKICVFYPHGGVSKVQRAQMATQEGNNVTVLAVEGNFDDAQTGVKNIFATVKDELTPGGARLSTANSINIGRLAPQIVYYFKAYADLLHKGTIQMGDKVNFCVPTGNFGDILAGYLAKKLGLPVGALICASNANNVLTDFINTGLYDRRRPLHKTISPSMDILVSSNLERLLFEVSGRNAKLTAQRMQDLAEKKVYEITPAEKEKIEEDFLGSFASEDDTVEAMYEIFDEVGYAMDTHTGVALAVYMKYKEYLYKKDKKDKTPIIVLSTANPYKFPQDVLYALSGNDVKDSFKGIKRLLLLTAMKPPKSLLDLRYRVPRFKTKVKNDLKEMAEVVLKLADGEIVPEPDQKA